MSSEPEILSEGNYQLRLADPQWTSPPRKVKPAPGVSRRRSGLDNTHTHAHAHAHAHANAHDLNRHLPRPHELQQQQQQQHQYVSPPPQIPSPGRSHLVTSPTDAPSQTRSPTYAHRAVTQTESDAGSLHVRFGRSNLSGDRNGNPSTAHTQRSTTSQKRSTDQMQGLDPMSQSDARPTKQPFSPSAPRPPQRFHNNPSGPPYQARRTTSNEAASPTQVSSGLPGHYHSFGKVSPEFLKQPLGSPPLSPLDRDAVDDVQLKQPSTRPITEPQLINEVKGIYAGLVMVERKCVDIIDQQTRSTKRLTDQQWKALVALHRTLLQEHHDFFSASQHPTASDNLKKLAIKYAMPARMWRHGIHAFLELLRHRLPDSMEHMLSFIYLAYSMMALLKESVPSFVETWIECLGDLARYRMAIEDSDPRDREVWSNVAKMWYNEAADKSPNVGRIQHHLAVLARPNIVEQLFYYDKALVTVVPFVNARESIMLLFDMFLKNNEAVQSRYPPTEYGFVYFNALLFTRGSPMECRRMLDLFSSSFGGHMDRAGARFKWQGPEMASALFAGLLDFGKEESYLWSLYSQQLKESEALKKVTEGQVTTSPKTEVENTHQKQKHYWENIKPDTPVDRITDARPLFEQETIGRSEDVVALAALLTTAGISTVASRMGDKNIVPFMHVVLANLWDMSFVAGALTYVESCIPWTVIALFLNTMGRSGVSYDNVEAEEFPPSHGGHGRQLPEDFIMRGMRTTRHYYKPGFFSEPLVDEDERTIELPSHQAPRAERCLWLGVRLASLGRYLTYNTHNQQFDTTYFAKSLAA